jgi:arginine decarboxylase
MALVPAKVFLTKGVGRHKYQLKSFEAALRQAGVAQVNLVQVSSILPPRCKLISKEKGVQLLIPGQIGFCVMARSDTNEHGRLVASAIGVALPKDKKQWGYLSEVHSHGMNNQQAADLAEDLAAGMLGTTLGFEIDPDKAWSEKEQAYKSSGLFIRTTNISQTALGKEGVWTTTVSIAMFLFE